MSANRERRNIEHRSAAVTVRLALVEPYTRDHTYCAYCPKLCRDLCPVSTAQGRETTTPWGKMSLLHHAAEGRAALAEESPERDPLSPSYAATFWACTGCMRCKTGCEHDNDVAPALMAGRAEAYVRGAAPASATAFVKSFGARSERSATLARECFGSDANDSTAPVAFLPGCTSVVVAPEDARAGWFAAKALSSRRVAVQADRCCGLPLLQAGDRDGFAKAARVHALRLSKRDLVIASDPGCAHLMRVGYPSLGIELRPRVVHLAELAGAELASLGRIEHTGETRYHDACHLGRGLGVYDAPRNVIARLTGRAPAELPRRRELAECSGGGGLLPITDPETASDIAAERARDHDRAGGGALVTACPTARRRMEKAGIEAIDLGRWIARAL